MQAWAILLSGLLMAASAQQPGYVGKVSRMLPKVDLTRAAKTMRVQAEDPVAQNDRLRTTSGGRARIALGDGSILNVGSSSELVVQATAAGTSASGLQLRYGRVRAWVASRSGGRSFEIRTNTALCGVLGTTIFVEASRDVTRVANLSDEAEARVRVTSTNPALTVEVILQPGEGTAVPAGRAPQPPRRWTREEMQAAFDETNM